MRKTVVTICSSADFYKKAVEVEEFLKANGFESIIPLTAKKMKKSGNWNPSHYRTWQVDEADYPKKSALMREHFNEIENGDVVLVVNDEKHGQSNYIGGNVLIEMAIAFYLNKPIYVMNDLPKDSKYLEEIKAMQPTVLKGNLRTLLDYLALYLPPPRLR